MTGNFVKIASVNLKVINYPAVGIKQVLSPMLSDIVATPKGYDDNSGSISQDTKVNKAVLFGRAAPNVSPVKTSASGASDGKITGTDTTMEYSKDGGSTWLPCQASETTGLPAGTYLVRYQATDELPASSTATVIITDGGTSPGPGPGPGPGGGGGSEGKTVTVPVSGDEKTVHVEAEVNGQEANLVIEADELDTVINKAVETGVVVIEVAALDMDISSAVIPHDAFSTIAEAANNPDNDVTGLRVEMKDGSVEFDAAALKSLSAQTGEYDLRLVVDDTDVAGLNAVQKDSLEEQNILAVYDIYMVSNGRRLTNFEGGQATVTVHHKLEDGQPIAGIVVLYVADNGEITKMPFVIEGREVVFTVTHFSNYVITYDKNAPGSHMGYADCPRDVTCPIEPFTDTVNDYWWHDGIHYCVENGLMVGFPGSIFGPNEPLSRAQIVMILWRMEGSPAVGYAMTFEDVPEGQWYTEAVRWAQSTGVVLGYSDRAFGPNDNITREQLAAILHRYAGYKKIDVSVRASLAKYTDVYEISDWAVENVRWANAAGMIQGRTLTTIVPKDDTTRAEAAAMIQRFCVNIIGYK